MKMQKRKIGLIAAVLICSAILAGCFGRTKPPYVMEQYTLDYALPKAGDRVPVDELLTVERFAVAPQFNSTSMMIRTGQYRFETHDYSRWYVNPADMVTGFILRDITRSGMFKGTYSQYDTELSRYTLEGYIEEFGETADGKAFAGIRITLIDTSRQNPVEQIIFQKHYAESAPISDRSANGLAAALSSAMQQLSTRLIADIDAAIRAKPGR
jgi:ABC-type uncharacterized transport system auxiliary subunit